ncbi:MAG: hypothetical protein ACKVOK_00590 [Flavobacteriales bacterium]
MNKETTKKNGMATNSDERMKFCFPDWNDILRKTNRSFQENSEFQNPELFKRIEYYISSMDELRQEYINNPVAIIVNFAYRLFDITKDNFERGLPNNQVIEVMENLQVGSNEFYAVFDVKKNDYTIVDKRIEEVLGFRPEDFSLPSMLGFKPNGLTIHPADACHMSRSALIAYMVICIPGFKWKAMKDFYRARVRANVSNSQLKVVREAEWLTLEKKAYMSHYETDEKNFIPMYHLKRWSVFDESEYSGTCPYFGGDPYQSTYRNVYWYLLHANLLDIPIKFILMLHSRQTKDRYKAIALDLNENMSKFNQLKIQFDEGQVADCFAKTIRPKIAEAINIWENRQEKLVILSDQESVAYAKTLGLLPVPKKVLELIYQNIDAN